MLIIFSVQTLSIAALIVRPGFWPMSLAAIAMCWIIVSHRGGRAILMCLFGGLAAALWSVRAISLHEADILRDVLHDVEVLTRVNVRLAPRMDSLGTRFEVSVDDPTLPARLAVFWPATVASGNVRRGECWQLKLRLRRLAGRRNPGVFDVVAWQRERGIGGRATVRKSVHNVRCEQQPAGAIEAARTRVGESLAAAPISAQGIAILRALLLGDRAPMSESLRETFAATGTSHLMAISGLHVGLVAGLGFLFGSRQPLPHRWLAPDRGIALGALLACGYVALAGFAITAQRALLTLLVVGVLLCARRRIDALSLVAVAALALFVFNPFRITDTGFVFSFSAVTMLALLQRRARARRSSRRRNAIVVVLQAQCLLSVGLAPLTMAWFGYVSAVALPVNLLVVPLFSLFVVPVALLGAVMALLVPPIAPILWRLLDSVLTRLVDALAGLATLSFARIEVGALTPALTLVAILLAGHMVLSFRHPGRLLALPALLAIVLMRAVPPAYGCLNVTMLDVGHGTAMTLQSARHYYVYDAGPAWPSGSDAGSRIVLPFLRARGAADIEVAVMSHADNDHIGGAGTLAKAAMVSRWLGALPHAPPCVAGQRWHSGAISFHVVWPVPELPAAGRGDNDASCVIRITGPTDSLLISGDIEAGAEREIVALRQLKADMVTVPHHGSATSSGDAFIADVDARIGWISAAADGRWQLPHPVVVNRWLASGTQLHNTAHHGALQTTLCRA